MYLDESNQIMTNTTTMLPPKTPQCPIPPNSHHSNSYHSENSLPDDDPSVILDNTCLNANLNEDSMMILSQSIDSIHTVGTNNGEGTEHQVRTLFVSGLPLDAKPRELYLLFRSFKISIICNNLFT
ncbi:RNA-binding protein with multiple splicing 2, variant 2 [Schistosoma haematobium]|uniref:RNA-binding protein with multiple splicing 2, variant 2 n=1 Tax=Schistosoma haematobium TaxID=6185 RepID=A0A922IHH7_SCHHA|nr:RNA-binding protein with multiple splicing 2, variant 2 [Schistosoma haematobium]KAH9579131.1 RNA-binding protein with multiple splicing 2, variant 2 [Schistosoma haematobium]